MSTDYLVIEPSGPLKGQVELVGAKNAVLVTMASLLLTRGVSRLKNVPNSADVRNMILVLESLGAQVSFFTEQHLLEVDTTFVDSWRVAPEIMQKMRASILVMGALLARFGKADVASPGGCAIGARPIDFHLQSFKKMQVNIQEDEQYIYARTKGLKAARIVLAYPSVGATENSILAATSAKGITTIVNAALEPEVQDLIDVLCAMGAVITVNAPATILIEGGHVLHPIEHEVVVDRLEAGSLLLAAAITGGDIYLPTARADMMDVFLEKLKEMGHSIEVGSDSIGIRLIATQSSKAVSFKTGPYPGFPTDLQAPMMVAQCIALGTSVIHETVFENRMVHISELIKMGAKIDAERTKAIVAGVPMLSGASVVATDIRASCALVLAGLVAEGRTEVYNIHHWYRGYEKLEDKLSALGAHIRIIRDVHVLEGVSKSYQQVQ